MQHLSYNWVLHYNLHLDTLIYNVKGYVAPSLFRKTQHSFFFFFCKEYFVSSLLFIFLENREAFPVSDKITIRDART